MEKLWAPWRMTYIHDNTEKPEGCVLCVDPDGRNDEKRMVLFRGKHCFVIINIYPYNNGHLMVAPYRHTSDFPGLTVAEKLEMMELTALCIDVEKEVMNSQGFNIGMNIGSVAGAGIDGHLHMHIVPRWNGDTNFMPVIGSVKVIPQSLQECYSILRKKFIEKVACVDNKE